jgi:hypothetical protein
MRLRRSAGLTYFFRPRGLTADLRAAVNPSFDAEEDRFAFPGCEVEPEVLPDECAGFFVL